MHVSRLIAIALAVAVAVPAEAQIATGAQHALLMDYETGEILFEKDGDVPMHPSSMSKLMTVELVFQRLKDGSLKLSDTFHVSEKAWREGADAKQSKMWVMVGTDISVEDLLKGIIVQSGNDACVVVAENLAGTEEAFAQTMTRRAKELGLTKSHFANSKGMPDPQEYMSARDIAKLSAHLIRTYPDYYPYFAMTEFTWEKIRQPNRNPLLTMGIGADGLKTGHTSVAGYGLAASAVRDGRRLILVVNGLSSERARAEESRRILDIGFRDFHRYELFRANDIITEAEVFGGAEYKVPLTLKSPLSVSMLRSMRSSMKVALRYDSPVLAPVTEGQQVGTLTVSAPGRPEMVKPVYAARTIERAGIFGRMWLGMTDLIGLD
ncbi:MAG: D-alanyl-D-alanine carboxypeptidase family protein [Alphaproteobacteria bacterium]